MLGAVVPIPTLELVVLKVTKSVPAALAMLMAVVESAVGLISDPEKMVTFPELSTVNLAVPDVEALIKGPVEVWLIVRADCPLEVASIASKSSTSNAPMAVAMLLLFELF